MRVDRAKGVGEGGTEVERDTGVEKGEAVMEEIAAVEGEVGAEEAEAEDEVVNRQRPKWDRARTWTVQKNDCLVFTSMVLRPSKSGLLVGRESMAGCISCMYSIQEEKENICNSRRRWVDGR